MAPDLDAVIGPLTGQSIASYHNGPSHSLVFAAAFGVVFGLVCRLFWKADTGFLMALGALAYGSHILIDWLTWGPGVLVFWPFLPEARFTSPISLFRGVRHSVNAPWSQHAWTVANDVAFGLIVWMVTWAIPRRQPQTAARPESDS